MKKATKFDSEVGIEPNAPQLGFRLCGGALQRLLAAVVSHFLHFLRGLPEKKIRTDRGAEHGRQRSERFLRELNVRNQGRACDVAPGNMDEEGYSDICKKREGQPLQIFH